MQTNALKRSNAGKIARNENCIKMGTTISEKPPYLVTMLLVIRNWLLKTFALLFHYFQSKFSADVELVLRNRILFFYFFGSLSPSHSHTHIHPLFYSLSRSLSLKGICWWNAWYSYKKIGLFGEKIRFVTAVDLIKCLNRIVLDCSLRAHLSHHLIWCKTYKYPYIILQ